MSKPLPKHTPGPWTSERVFFCDGDQDHEYWTIKPVSWKAGSLAATSQGNVGGQESEANARLIAAAPCMLEALKRASARILSLNGPNDEAGVQCERAIAKAEGV